MGGFVPVLAHPERYTYYHANPEIFAEYKNRGCKLQLNTLSLSGYYGRSVKQTAEYLMDKKLYDYCGSDIHHLRHADKLEKMLQIAPVYKMLSGYQFANATM